MGKELATADLMKAIQRGVEELQDPREVMNLFAQLEIPFSTGEEIHHGFTIVSGDEKERLFMAHMNQPVFVTDWEFMDGDYGDEFVDFRFVSKDGKYRTQVGGSGINAQLHEVTAHRIANPDKGLLPQAGLLVERGFRNSGTYYFDERTKKAIPNGKLHEVPEEFRKPGSPVWYFNF